MRVIRDRQTSKKEHVSQNKTTNPRLEQSRQFGFLRFTSGKEAETFMDKNYPTIYLYGSDGTGGGPDEAKVRIAYGRERKDASRNEEADWTCKVVSHTVHNIGSI